MRLKINWALLFPAWATLMSPAAAFQLSEGIVADPASSRLYVMTSEGGIEAVNPSDGAVLASTTAAKKPLLVAGGALLAQAEPTGDNLSIVSMRTEDLRVIFSIRLPLPEGVRGAVADQLGASFSVAPTLVPPDSYLIAWRSIQRRVRGVQSESGLLDAETGAALIDTKNGRLKQSWKGPPPSAFAEQQDDRSGSSVDPIRCDAGAFFATIRIENDRVFLRHRTKDGEVSKEFKLFDNGHEHFMNFSADCKHVLSSEADGSRWRIYSVATGQQVAQVPDGAPAMDFFVRDETMIFVRPASAVVESGHLISMSRQLVARNFTGKELWSKPVPEISYRGPYPGRPSGLSTDDAGAIK